MDDWDFGTTGKSGKLTRQRKKAYSSDSSYSHYDALREARDAVTQEKREKLDEEASYYFFRRRSLFLIGGVAAISAGFSTLLMGTVPMLRTVHETKVVTTENRIKNITETIDLTSGCLQGKSGIVQRVFSEAYSQPTKEDAEAWIWISFAKIKTDDEGVITCKFEGIDLPKIWEAGDTVKPAGGKRL